MKGNLYYRIRDAELTEASYLVFSGGYEQPVTDHDK